MKTQSELNDLKRQWLNDPCWDIEDTEGFEVYASTLKQWRLDIEREHKRREQARLESHALYLGCSVTVVKVIERLERRIADLEKKVND